MKAVMKLSLVLAMLVLMPALSWAAAAVGAGISGTDHDFTSGGGGSHPTPFAGDVGLCTYCHTPHKANSTELLWNHTLSLNATFSWDAKQTTNGTPYATIKNTWNGPTAKCLSCHDGSVAIGDVYWFKEQAQVLDPFKLGSDGDTSHVVGAGGAMKGNHPVAMPYPYAGAANTYNGQTTSSAALPGYGFVAGEWQATPLTPIRLFNDDGSGTITAGPQNGKTGIECSSCHDPHNKASVDVYLLRGKLTGTTGYICLNCHIK